MFVQQGHAQTLFKRHYWINPLSYNHTLYPTSDGGYILAAARQELGAGLKNTIAVLKLDAAYQTQMTRIIGLPGGEDFNREVDFEVHDVIETINNGFYVICGSIRHITDEGVLVECGMVTIIDMGLNVQSIREYPEVETFYSVYSEDNHYYVCGKTKNEEGTVLQDDIFGLNPIVWITHDKWIYHKIRIKTKPLYTFIVSCTDGREIGYTAFDFSGGNLVPVNTTGIDESWKIAQPLYPNSKAIITNYPGNALGLILSASDGNNIYTYLFDQYQPTSMPMLFTAFSIPCSGIIEDINCSPNKLAWVGNYPMQTAFYLSLTMSVPGIMMPGFLGNISVPFINFNPHPPMDMAYYSLHKVHYNKNFDLKFHAGGFYHYGRNNNRTTFVVAPEQAIEYCGDVKIEYTTEFTPPLPLIPLPLIMKDTPVNDIERTDREINFCPTECDDEFGENNQSCGNNK